MQFKVIPVTAFEQNCSIIWCEETRKAAVVDPGGDLDRILSALDFEDLELEKILVTHAHIDHAGAVSTLAALRKVPIEGPALEDKFWIDLLPQQSQMFGFPEAETFEPTRWLADGDEVTVGKEVLQVIHCPGHTPGHVVFYNKARGLALVGDVLFHGSIGRTDFPKGDHATLISSIRDKLWPLGDDISFVPGHGPMSTFGDEKENNPYVKV
ncbi:MBL fold metallo-hydrolase [Allohahella marinimesophila]|uniref:MBL fold metallo-hydrolase n=1 Tax=Allohahella marinimesophila TaxID=1054972 RepID=A0ABP7NGV3_9GAMM